MRSDGGALAVAHYAAEHTDFVWIYFWQRARSYSIGFPVTGEDPARCTLRVSPHCPKNFAIAPDVSGQTLKRCSNRVSVRAAKSSMTKDKTDSWSYPIEARKVRMVFVCRTELFCRSGSTQRTAFSFVRSQQNTLVSAETGFRLKIFAL